MQEADWLLLLGWTLLVVVAYPLLTLVVAEWSRRIGENQSALKRSLRVVQTLLLPTFAIWLVVNKVTALPPDTLLGRVVETAFGIATLYTLLVLAQGVLGSVAARSNAPRLLYDIALSVLVVIGGAVIISTVWGFSLTSLLSAVGVGSLVMGLALQNVIGGMVSGVLLLSARQFSIGDWLRTGSNMGRIIQIDWRSVTLELSSTERLVLPSSSLSSGSFSVIGGSQPGVAAASVIIGYQHSPDRARAMLQEAAGSVPQLMPGGRVSCRVAEYGPAGIQYNVSVPVADPSRSGAARDELLSRIWYVAQRHGISVVPPTTAQESNLPPYGQTAGERADMRAATGIFRRPASSLIELAEAARLQRWRSGEIILQPDERADAILVVLQGSISTFVQAGSVRIELDSLSSGEVFAIREAFRGAASPLGVSASAETELLAVPASAMQRLLDREPALAAEVEGILEARALALRNLTTRPASLAA